MNKPIALFALITTLGLGGCVGTIIEATTDAAIAVVKIPFKIGGAAVDMMKGEDPDDVGRKAKPDDDEADDEKSQGS